jgi:hypothetical protein
MNQLKSIKYDCIVLHDFKFCLLNKKHKVNLFLTLPIIIIQNIKITSITNVFKNIEIYLIVLKSLEILLIS